ncbi:MAG: tRNA uridine-5-carboxymethylaminomethyl(34) synthesis GTPase MnmE [Lentisphaerae bacterium]|nr:tRNA uridine-5-carboxymethylaminomethyl(34) synthesis GTPase MnmE [Lentisphaerota bacterium]
MNTVDTIAAVATAPGGAINIVRISGDDALQAACNVWHGKKTLCRENARMMLYGLIGDPGEPALAVYMPRPHSYTGEDVVELHCHGGAVAVRRTMEAVLKNRCVRSAEPGEFTMRAFVNGKIDLAQAEAVSDIINASSDATYNLAVRQLEGKLSSSVNAIREILLLLAADCESRLDFPDEELDFDNAALLLERLNQAQAALQELIKSAHAGAVLRQGVRISLAGKPNAGKSSLLNALLGIDRAIVSNIPGTTRDTLAEQAVLRQIPVEITDTAGLRESDDEIEALGIARARQAMLQAQVVFYLLDASAEDLEAEVAEFQLNRTSNIQQLIVVWNKTDLSAGRTLPDIPEVDTVKISAKTGENLDGLLDCFEKLIWQDQGNGADTPAAVNARHLALLQAAECALEPAAQEIIDGNWELAAANLRLALVETGRIVGETVEPDLLNEIFSRFCIGK